RLAGRRGGDPGDRAAVWHVSGDSGRVIGDKFPITNHQSRITNHESPIPLQSAHPKPRPAPAIHPDRIAGPAPGAAFLAAGAGQLLHQHRASAAAIPVAGAAALVLAAAGHAVIAGAGRTRAMARRRAAGDGEFGAAAVVHPQAGAALAPGAAFHAGGLRQLPHQHRAAVDGAGPALVVLALAAHQFAGAAAVPAAAAFGEASTTAIVDPHGAAAAAEIAAFDAARAGDVLHQHR